jgi:aerobic-type carbon monoxide dehydrogenase small subunit (CoxS/CutS family)
MSARALLDEKAEPSVEEIKEAIAGNLCRCTGYFQVVEAIEAAIQSQPKGPTTRTRRHEDQS